MWNKLLRANLVIWALIAVGGCCEQERQQLNDLKMREQDLNAEIQRLKGELDDKQRELEAAQNKLADLTGQRGNLEKELARLRQLQAQAPAGWQVKKGMIMTSIPESVLFDSGKAVLKPTAAGSLNRVIGQIRANFPGRDVYVVGNTDTDRIMRSKWKDNLELSLHRAAAVTRYMTAHGMSSKQIVSAGVGEFRPVASNASPQGKSRNRRVEFWILKPM
jgi:chemotaxis protein MotB